jgi:hypothetical protein
MWRWGRVIGRGRNAARLETPAQRLVGDSAGAGGEAIFNPPGIFAGGGRCRRAGGVLCAGGFAACVSLM